MEIKEEIHETICEIRPLLEPKPYKVDSVKKHGEHDQQTHGSWANGELSDEQKGVVSAWTSLSNKSSWRQIANDLSEGKTPNASEDDIKTVKTLVDAIKQNGVIPAEALGRAELLTTGLRWQGALPKVGDSLKNELSSATLDERTSERFSQYSDFGGSKGKPVIFHYGFQTKGLDVNRAGADAFADEQEWLVSGTFKITDKYSENGITHLNLKPIDSVKKHGSHDQKTHGNWATGNFDEETQGEDAQNEYFERYGFTTDGDPAGTTREEIDALGYYATDGYKTINEGLRNGTAYGYDTTHIGHLDNLIEESPDIFGDKTLYRVMDDEVISSLQPGDIYIDKGYTSTTRVDITDDENIFVKQDLLSITDTNNTVAVILPNETKNGKGLAVDMYANATDGVIRANGVLTAQAEREKEILLPRSTPLTFIGMKGKVAVFQRTDG